MCESSSTVLKNLKQRRCILGSVVEPEPEPDTRGLQFILFWNWIRNQTENDRYWQKITFYFLQNVEFIVFFAFEFKVCKSAIMTQTIFFS
jgi:hypothetical protein